jgi:hypothetical protein
MIDLTVPEGSLVHPEEKGVRPIYSFISRLIDAAVLILQKTAQILS